MALDRPFQRTSAPVILDRAEVKAYADRVEMGVQSLSRSIAKHKVDWSTASIPAGWSNPKTGSVDLSLPVLPSDFVLAYRDFQVSWSDFYSSIQSFNPVGPTAWSAWDSVEGYESQLKAFRNKYIGYGGKVEAPIPVPPSVVNKEHPGSWDPFGGNLSLFLGLGVAVAAVVLIRPYLPSTEKKNVPV